MSTELEKKVDNAQSMIKQAQEQIDAIKKQLANTPHQEDPTPIVDLDKIHTWEDVAKAYNIDPVNSLPRPTPKNADEENDNSYFQAKRIVKLFNQDNKFPNYDNDKQSKLNPAFDLRNSGVGFSRSHYVFWHSSSYVGARLSWKEYKTMEEVVTKRFPDVWAKLMR